MTSPTGWSWPGLVASLRRGCRAADREAPHCRIRSFLSPRVADLLLHDMIDRRSQFRSRGISRSGGPVFYRMTSPLSLIPEFVDRFEAVAPVLERRFETDLRRPRLELVGQAYNDGGSFGKHRDADAGGPNWQRRLSGIYYLHRRPRKFTGGSLAIYDRRGYAHLVEPDHNCAVFFPRDALHEVLPVFCASRAFEDSRFAINVWIS